MSITDVWTFPPLPVQPNQLPRHVPCSSILVVPLSMMIWRTWLSCGMPRTVIVIDVSKMNSVWCFGIWKQPRTLAAKCKWTTHHRTITARPYLNRINWCPSSILFIFCSFEDLRMKLREAKDQCELSFNDADIISGVRFSHHRTRRTEPHLKAQGNPNL
jgi:hypothetical protein